MTISDDLDEDADNLDDGDLMETYLSAGQSLRSAEIAQLPDWPPTRDSIIGFPVDHQTLAWFKANHLDWQRQMGFVLRAWVVAQTDLSSDQGSAQGPAQGMAKPGQDT